ncbi:receptivity factor prfa3, putative [Microscilla marina ATCC 23134]|uniref:Receptivity factor prfa3, putative n=1 Tax=Microscilla marina ATCC 23134 TaxID=313606 RepID=A1ZQY2_MICM2|nr:receptivity factor prfa3, putative [Microscilla marina ATCC 23134]
MFKVPIKLSLLANFKQALKNQSNLMKKLANFKSQALTKAEANSIVGGKKRLYSYIGEAGDLSIFKTTERGIARKMKKYADIVLCEPTDDEYLWGK